MNWCIHQSDEYVFSCRIQIYPHGQRNEFGEKLLWSLRRYRLIPFLDSQNQQNEETIPLKF